MYQRVQKTFDLNYALGSLAIKKPLNKQENYIMNILKAYFIVPYVSLSEMPKNVSVRAA